MFSIGKVSIPQNCLAISYEGKLHLPYDQQFHSKVVIQTK